MITKDNPPEQATKLRIRVEAVAREKAAQSPGKIEALSPEEMRKVLHDFQKHQIRLEMQVEELQKTLKRYRDFFENAVVGVFQITPEGGYLYANPSLAALFGFDTPQMLMGEITDIGRQQYVNPENRKTYKTTLETVGIIKGFEVQLLKKDKIPIWVSISARAVRNDGGGLLYYEGTITDISERKRVEAALYESERKARSIFDFSFGFIGLLRPDGTLIEVNETALDFTGTTLADVSGKPFWETPWWSHAPEMQERIRSAVETAATGKLVRSDAIHPAKDGTSHIIDFTLKPIMDEAERVIWLIAEARDITEHKRAEAALKESEKRFRDLAEMLPEAVFETDRGLKITLANRRAFELFGYSVEDLKRGMNGFELLAPEDRDRAKANMARRLKGEDLGAIEYMALRKDGSIFPMLFHLSPIMNEGAAIGFRGIAVDITDRKRAEEALHDSERKYRELFELSPVGIFQTSAKGQLLFVNPEMTRFIGANSPEEAMEKLHDVASDFYVDPNRRKAFIALLKDKGVVKNFEFEAKRLDGKHIWLSMNAIAQGMPSDDTFLINGFITDITERKIAEKQRALNEHGTQVLLQLNQMTEATLQEVTDFSLEEAVRLTESTIGYLAFLNDDESVLTMHSWSKSAMAECAILDKPIMYPVETTGLWGEAVRQRKPIITNDYTASCPLKKGYPEGHVPVSRHMNIPVFVGPKIVLVAGVGNKVEAYDQDDVRQLTLLMEGMWRLIERKRAEEALREREESLRAILASSPNPIVMYASKGDPLFINPAFTDIFGWTLDELKGRCIPFVPEDKKKITMEAVHKIYSSGEPSVFETQRYTKDGRTLDIIVNAAVFMGPDDIPSGMVVNLTDITERKKLQAQYEQAQKMEAIGTLAGGIAHDFNNLLMGIQGRATLIAFNLEPADANFEHINAIDECVRRASDLTKQLLGFARAGKYEVKPIDMNEVVLSSSAMFGRTQKQIQIHTNLSSLTPVVEADRGQIEQVLLNMYINAWQAMPDGGELFLETVIVTLDDQYCKPHLAAAGPYAKVSVTDTGIGMDDATCHRVFDPFFSTKEKGRGTGLGLASAYGIVKNHGGMVTVYSEIGHGTTFTIYLPISDKQVFRELPMESGLFKGSETILIVDDEELVIDVARAMLEKLGYGVIVAKGGQQAVEAVKSTGNQIDLVVLDLIMPGMDGGQTFDRIQEIQPNMPMILSSGYAINGQANEILGRGCKAFIQKPFNFTDLSKIIRKVLDEAKGQAAT